ncbi:MAG: glucosamine-6-phosphate deaminase [Spirochaetes bacterium]|nr:glucosamine-6-phosphate deaminase [Spirochaetota bacterium]
MNDIVPCGRFRADALEVIVFGDRRTMGTAAAADCAEAIRDVLVRQEICRMVFAAAPSQDELLSGLVGAGGIDWARVHAFHMDEYLGLVSDAPQRFGIYLRDRFFGLLPFGSVDYLNSGWLSGPEEAVRYAALLAEAPIDIVCLGVGENGHIAFNDPEVADFDDPLAVKEVSLDRECRRQQVHDGCFPDFDAVPEKALTLTIPTLMAGKRLFCVVPGSRKAEAVRKMLTGPIAVACPASVLRRHGNCFLYLDADSAGRLR